MAVIAARHTQQAGATQIFALMICDNTDKYDQTGFHQLSGGAGKSNLNCGCVNKRKHSINRHWVSWRIDTHWLSGKVASRVILFIKNYDSSYFHQVSRSQWHIQTISLLLAYAQIMVKITSHLPCPFPASMSDNTHQSICSLAVPAYLPCYTQLITAKVNCKTVQMKIKEMTFA